jgi:hypothetical protein
MQVTPFSLKLGIPEGALCSTQLAPASVVARITAPLVPEDTRNDLFPTAIQLATVGQEMLSRSAIPCGMDALIHDVPR